MLHGFDELTTQAHQLVAAGDLAGARDLLDRALAASPAADSGEGYVDPGLAAAAALHARVLLALGEPNAARHWAALAYSTISREYGPGDEQSIAAGATLAAVLHRVGSHARSAHLYRQVITGLAALDGPDSLRVLAAEADLATVEHARGECTAARERLAEAWALHHEVYGESNANGIKMLARLGAMERDCGRVVDADERFALAERLCRRHLPPGHSLADQVTALASSSGDPAHICSTRPSSPPSALPELLHTPPAPASAAPPPPSTPAATAAAAASDRGARRDPVGEEEPLRPPETAIPGADGPPEAMTGQEPGVWRVRPAREPGAEEPPAAAFPPLQRRSLPVSVTGLVILLLGAVAVGAGIALVAGDHTWSASSETLATTPPASPTASAAPGPTTPSAEPAEPPTGLALRDTRDAVTLTWIYPSGAEGPIVVSGGRDGQPPRAFQELPPGTARHILYGLNPNLDYCFSVAVVYSTDQISRSGTVCTTRARSTGRG
ncbi:MAG TPA: tetratricopeptide repeat protein [Micromonospora sp.]|nr:tetratricopeptide repeat protein [Micromonospora sp.]